MNRRLVWHLREHCAAQRHFPRSARLCQKPPVSTWDQAWPSRHFSMSTARRSPTGASQAARPAWSGSAAIDRTCSAPRPKRCRLGRAHRPRLPAPRLFRPWRIRRRLRRRHHLEVAERKPRRLPAFHQRTASARRLVHGRLDRAAAGTGAAQGGRGRPHRRSGSARARARLHRRTHRTGTDEEAEARAGGEGLFRGKVRIFARAQYLYPRPDRGRSSRTAS